MPGSVRAAPGPPGAAEFSYETADPAGHDAADPGPWPYEEASAGRSRIPPPPGSSFVPYGEDDAPGPMARVRNLVSGDELDPGRPGLRVLLVVGVVAVLVGAWYWWQARPHEEPLPTPSPVSSAGAHPRPAPGTPAPSPSATAVVVDVSGKVRHPGVVRLPPGSRVVDAIRAAGGVKRGAPTGALNLARILVDGEQILVGASSAPTPGPVPPSGASPASPAVSLNTATEEQLDTLSGVGPVLAKRIVEYRTQHGGFRSVDELQDVDGIGPKRFADLKSEVTL